MNFKALVHEEATYFLCLCRAHPTNLYCNGAGLSPNYSHDMIESAAPVFRCAAILTPELLFMELVEMRNETWEKLFAIF